jgi:hypothetical protein
MSPSPLLSSSNVGLSAAERCEDGCEAQEAERHREPTAPACFSDRRDERRRDCNGAGSDDPHELVAVALRTAQRSRQLRSRGLNFLFG